MEHRLTNFSPSWVKALTFDNGKEFAQHQKIGKLLNTKTILQDLTPLKAKIQWEIE